MKMEGGASEPESQTENPRCVHPSKDPAYSADVNMWQMRADRKWEKKWGFLRTLDFTGKPKQEDPFHSYVSLYSDRFPKTSNQTYGSRLFTPLGQELIRLDRSLFWCKTHQHDPRTSRGESTNASEWSSAHINH
ncbi:uncharacterized protein C2orf50 homolog [Nothobranchius furzeri]|uniref:Uncharacterized protein n=1 Tax=Nothobranchius furzeri TaxID=105023 RepID=A0A9D2Y077_NOTFU|nr:uncharacterized protein C2orf50 homolog [Nothobranchius furzeri]KAF7211535.1 hypothetical protein G4P62_018300 [Nothobranchius furzeri]